MALTVRMYLVAVLPVVATTINVDVQSIDVVGSGVGVARKRSNVVRRAEKAQQEFWLFSKPALKSKVPAKVPDWMNACLTNSKTESTKPDMTPSSIALACGSGAAQGKWRKAFSATEPAINAKAANASGAASNFTVSLDDILRASAEKFPWALERLSNKFQRLANDPTAHLTIAILGNSMTAGHGTDKACGYCNKWSNRMEAYFHQQGFPNVHVKNMGKIGGSTSRFRFDGGLAYDEQMADVFLMDYSISDAPPCCGYKSFAEVTQVTEHWVRLLLSLPSQPAVVFIETFTASELFGFSCKHSADEYPHHETLKKFMVPTIDYNAAVCPEKSSNTQWQSMEGGPHPDAAPTHENVGRVAAGYFFRLLERLCSPTENTGFMNHPAEIFEPFKDAALGCAIKPLMRMDAARGAENFPSHSRDASSWCFAEDKAGRPGWIAMPGQVPGNVSFVINTKEHFRLKMTFLKTYEKIGSIKCTVGGSNQQEFSGKDSFTQKIVALDKEAKESFFDSYTFPVVLPPGAHELVCLSDGSKFKIVGLSACAAV